MVVNSLVVLAEAPEEDLLAQRLEERLVGGVARRSRRARRRLRARAGAPLRLNRDVPALSGPYGYLKRGTSI